MNGTTLSTLAALAALAACTHQSADTAPPATPKAEPVAALADGHVSRDEMDAASRDLEQSLKRLVALDISDVGALIDDMPEGAMNCYGPCEDDPVAQAWMQEQVTKIDRFHDLVDTTEKLVRRRKTTETHAAVEAIVALQLVEIEVRRK